MATVKTMQNACFVLVGVSLILQCVGFILPYWIVVYESNKRLTVFTGLWHEVLCRTYNSNAKQQACRSITHEQSLKEATKIDDASASELFLYNLTNILMSLYQRICHIYENFELERSLVIYGYVT